MLSSRCGLGSASGSGIRSDTVQCSPNKTAVKRQTWRQARRSNQSRSHCQGGKPWTVVVPLQNRWGPGVLFQLKCSSQGKGSLALDSRPLHSSSCQWSSWPCLHPDELYTLSPGGRISPRSLSFLHLPENSLSLNNSLHSLVTV